MDTRSAAAAASPRPHSPSRRPAGSASSHAVLVVTLDEFLQRETDHATTEDTGGASGGSTNVKTVVAVTTPRTLEACKRLGIDTRELVLPPRSDLLFTVGSPTHKAAAAGSGGGLLRQPDRPSTAPAALPPEVQEKKYAHYRARLLEELCMVKRERQTILQREKGEGESLPPEHYQQYPFAPSGAGSVASDVEGRAAQLKSAMMEMERRRLEAIKIRQQKEFLRLMEGEKQMVTLQQKLLRQQELEIQRKKAHEKAVAEHRKLEIEKKKQRDKELQLEAEQEQQRQREIARKDAELKAKLAAEARRAERSRRKEAVAREQERHAKLEALRARTDELIRQQEVRAERHRQVIEEREARVRAQVQAKQQRKAQEVQQRRERAERRIRSALERNQQLQAAKRAEYEARVAAATARAQQKQGEEREAAAKAAQAREARQARRDQRLADAAEALQAKVRRTLDRAQQRSRFYAIVGAQREKEAQLLKLGEDLRREDKLDNVRRIQRQDAYQRSCFLAKQAADDERYARIKEERAYLIRRRKETAHQAMLRKHRLKDAMEQMKVTNRFTSLDSLLADAQGDNKASSGGSGGRRPFTAGTAARGESRGGGHGGEMGHYYYEEDGRTGLFGASSPVPGGAGTGRLLG